MQQYLTTILLLFPGYIPVYLFVHTENDKEVYAGALPASFIQNNGELHINNFHINGAGIYSIIIANYGNLYINYLITNYSTYYDRYNYESLNINFFIRNLGDIACAGNVYINNSYIYGAALVAFWFQNGNLFMDNTIIELSSSAFLISIDAMYFAINNVILNDIGTNYLSLVDNLQEVVLPPLTIASQHTSIINCKFRYYDP